MATNESLARVQELYVAYYGRPADQDGQTYWAERMDEEGEDAIINAFGNSEEYTALAEGKGNATLINNVYQQAFGREADPEGLTFYAGQLESGEKTLAEIATTIINAAGGIDKQTLNARVEAASEYTEAFGSADDYDVVAGKDAVESAEPGIYTPELTPAIEELQAAQQAESDYRQDEVASNDDVAKALEDNAEVDADKATDQQISNALDTVVDSKAAAVNQAGSITLNSNASVAAAQINAKQDELEKNEQGAKDTVAETDGLLGAISSLKAAEGRYEDALKAEIKTDKALDGEVAKYNSLNGNAGQDVVSAEENGTITGLITEENGTLVAAEDVDPASLEGFDALLQSAQAQYDATQDVEKYKGALDNAVDKVVDLDDTLSGASVGTDGEVSFETTTEGDPSDTETLLNAENQLEAFNKAVSEYEEVVALQNKEEQLGSDVDSAKEAFDDLDVNLGSITDGDDLFIFDADNIEDITAGFGENGDDQLYIGDSFTRVDLDSDVELEDSDQGSVDTMEVFFQQDGSDTVLSFEDKAFAGNAESGFDGVNLTLTGVNADDLQLDNGYVSIA